MKIGLVSDIHANSWAWKAVQKELDGVDCIILLGDLIGYGPGGVECISDFLGDAFAYWVPGNHERDWIYIHRLLQSNGRLAGRERLLECWEKVKHFWRCPETLLNAAGMANQLAVEIMPDLQHGEGALLPLEFAFQISGRSEAIASWLHLELELLEKQEGEEFLDKILSPDPRVLHELETSGLKFLISHGFGDESTYLLPWAGLTLNGHGFTDESTYWIDPQECGVILFGHSHVPVYTPLDSPADRQDLDTSRMNYGEWMPLGRWATLINPGSVGWPRDMDVRPAYAVLDTDRRAVCYCRVDTGYNRREVVERMSQKGYPNRLFPEIINANAGFNFGHQEQRALEILETRRNLPGGSWHNGG